MKAYSCVHQNTLNTGSPPLSLSTDPDGLNDLSEGQLCGEGIAVIDEWFSYSSHTQSWGEQ